MYNLAALFALYPRFYVIKSAYANSKYRFLETFSGCLFAQTIGSLKNKKYRPKTSLPQIRHLHRSSFRLAFFFLAPAICHIANIARIARASIGAFAHGVASARFYIGAIAPIGQIQIAGIRRAQVTRIAAAHIQAARIAWHAIAALVIRHAVYAINRRRRRLGWGV